MTPEQEVKKEIYDYLSTRKCFFWAQQNVGIRGRKLSGNQKRGVPDIFVISKGRLILIEAKAPGGSISQSQIEFAREAESHGAIVVFAFSLEDVKKRLEVEL